jgi:hypothetical protein
LPTFPETLVFVHRHILNLLLQMDNTNPTNMTADNLPDAADVDTEFVDVSFAHDGGVCKKILQVAPDGARGPPPKGNEIEAHYTGTLDVCKEEINFHATQGGNTLLQEDCVQHCPSTKEHACAIIATIPTSSFVIFSGAYRNFGFGWQQIRFQPRSK